MDGVSWAAALHHGPLLAVSAQTTTGFSSFAVGGLADAPLLASMCRGTLLVVEAGNTHRGAVMAAVRRLRFARAQMIGVVLNKFDARQAGHAYGHGLVYGGTGYYGQG